MFVIITVNRATYIPNFDEMSINTKRQLLSDIFGLDDQLLLELDVNYQFNKRVYKTIIELEKDIARPS